MDYSRKNARLIKYPPADLFPLTFREEEEALEREGQVCGGEGGAKDCMAAFNAGFPQN
jgi:hypothetical protein